MVKANEDLALGIDIGKTKISVGVVDVASKTILKTYSDLLKVTDKAHILELTYRLIVNALSDYRFSNVGIGSFGVIDSVNGIALSSRMVQDWTNVPLVRDIKNRFGFDRVVLENDAVAAAVGEYAYAEESRDTVMITVGTSVGVGIVTNGMILRGAHNMSGQIAHLEIFDNYTVGEMCGGQGMSYRMRKECGIDASAKEIIEMAQNDNGSRAFGIVADAAHGLGLVARFIGKIIDPDVILFGGSIPIKNDWFFRLIVDECKKSQTGCGKVEIGRNKLGVDSAVFGGAVLCKKTV